MQGTGLSEAQGDYLVLMIYNVTVILRRRPKRKKKILKKNINNDFHFFILSSHKMQ